MSLRPIAKRFIRFVNRLGLGAVPITLKSRAAAAAGSSLNLMGRESLPSSWPSQAMNAFAYIKPAESPSELNREAIGTPEGTVFQWILDVDVPVGTGVNSGGTFYPVTMLDVITFNNGDDYEIQDVAPHPSHITLMCKRKIQ